MVPRNFLISRVAHLVHLLAGTGQGKQRVSPKIVDDFHFDLLWQGHQVVPHDFHLRISEIIQICENEVHSS